jgi:dTDP-4-amino-4,6-dideoxygalactose transaminase
VILPAYSCPDLVSAIVFAGARPVLVDLEANRPWMDLAQVAEKISAQTAAILGVNLFGIPERLPELKNLADRAGSILIEDSAQAFPGTGENGTWQGDLVVLSFGRGKPVSLLGGGAVLSGNNALAKLLPKSAIQPSGGFSKRLLFGLKAGLYNRMISPRFYWLPQSLPFLNLGETRYHPLTSIEAMDSDRYALLPSNVKTYLDRSMEVQQSLHAMLAEMKSEEHGITDLPRVCKTPEDARLLRYPLLVESELRDSLFARLRLSGTGVSRMYPAALPGIAGLEKILSGQGDFPAARSFSDRLLTLATHSQVSQADIARISGVLSR